MKRTSNDNTDTSVKFKPRLADEAEQCNKCFAFFERNSARCPKCYTKKDGMRKMEKYVVVKENVQ